jgi:hypothetical protein
MGILAAPIIGDSLDIPVKRAQNDDVSHGVISSDRRQVLLVLPFG